MALEECCPNLDDIESIEKMESVYQAWINGELSNFDFLIYINFISNRSFNDLSQYPIFPWVLSNYKFSEFDLEKDKSFRDLSKPIGTLFLDKLDQFKLKYDEKLRKKTSLQNNF